MLTKEYLNAIKPKIKGESDKYSWNLYRYLKEHPCSKVYKDRDGLKLVLSENPNRFYGSSLNQIIRGDMTCFAFDRGRFFEEIPGFLEQYERIGRCLFVPHDMQWVLGSKHRFTYVNAHSRRCNWCGKWFTRTIEKETIINRLEKWE